MTNKSEDIKNLISEFNKCFNHPFIAHDLRKFNLTNEELDSIKNNIIEDVINKKIHGENINAKSIFIAYCENFANSKNVLSDEELDEILSGLDLNNIDKSIVDQCKTIVKKEYESHQITKDQILIKFKKLISKKIEEIKQLNDLEEIKINPNIPIIKRHLSDNDCVLIYNLTEEKICSEFGLRGSVLGFVETQMYRKNEKNKSEAREEFKSYRYNRKYFLGLTNLRNEDIENFVRDVEVLIGENKIKTDDFDEEFIQELSLSFKMYRRIIL